MYQEFKEKNRLISLTLAYLLREAQGENKVIKLIALPLIDIEESMEEEVICQCLEVLEEKKALYIPIHTVDFRRARKANKLLILNTNSIYVGDVISYESFAQGGRPLDADLYCPEVYQNYDQKCWFKLRNLKRISEEELESIEISHSGLQMQYGGVENYLEGTRRRQIFYCQIG